MLYNFYNLQLKMIGPSNNRNDMLFVKLIFKLILQTENIIHEYRSFYVISNHRRYFLLTLSLAL